MHFIHSIQNTLTYPPTIHIRLLNYIQHLSLILFIANHLLHINHSILLPIWKRQNIWISRQSLWIQMERHWFCTHTMKKPLQWNQCFMTAVSRKIKKCDSHMNHCRWVGTWLGWVITDESLRTSIILVVIWVGGNN